MKIPLAKPDIKEEDIKSVIEVLKTPFLSLGPKLLEFEEKIRNFVGVKYSVVVNSGTSALHLIIKSIGIKKGDEVITTSFSFISSSNCIIFEEGTPVFVDIEEDNYNINPDLIEEKITEKTKAILAVDVFGNPADWEKLEKIAKKYNLFLIEDSAEAVGSKLKDRMCGSFGNAGIFSFYPNKQITTGEGGVILTNDESIYSLSRSFRNQGRGDDNKWLEHIRIGYNYRLSDINCALGISQLNRIDEIINKRRKVYEIYNEYLSDIDEIILPKEKNGVFVNWFNYVIRLRDKFNKIDRDNLIKFLNESGIECKNYFPPIHLQPFYKNKFKFKEGDLPITEKISDRTISIPFFNNLSEIEIKYIKEKLKEGLIKIRN
ncbi:MAG: DegT/DnrJ/EryC1/StrS family aminotransferase [Nitrososphaerota archaeon]